MSRRRKNKRGRRRRSREAQTRRGAPAPSGSGSGGNAPRERETLDEAGVAALLEEGAIREALDAAKALAKGEPSPAHDELALRAYDERFWQLLRKRLVREAASLVDVIASRGEGGARLARELRASVAARRGHVRALAELLLSAHGTDALSPRSALLVRRSLADPRLLARCDALPDDHPVRTQAAAVSTALEAVTRGPVDGPDEVALRGVPRRSPLAPWKTLVRAIAAYHARDDDAVRELTARIPDDAPPARLGEALRALVGGAGEADPAARALADAIVGRDELREACERLDAAFDRRRKGAILSAIRHVVGVAARTGSARLERIVQHVAIRSLMAGIKAPDVRRAAGRSSYKDAYFWRLNARACEVLAERTRDAARLVSASAAWEEFRRGAIDEGWFAADGPEVAATYLHMAGNLARVAPEDLARLRDSPHGLRALHADIRQAYREQPPEIARRASSGAHDPGIADPAELYARACRAHPASETFSTWMEWSRKRGPKEAERVAKEWHAARPDDVRPILELMQAAEGRGALNKARSFLRKAESIDGLSADVDAARLRLELGIARRHLAKGQFHLLDKDFAALEAMPRFAAGDGPAVLLALRWVAARRSGAPASELAGRVGAAMEDDPAADSLMAGIAEALRPRRDASPRDGASVLPTSAAARSAARAASAARALGVPFHLTSPWRAALRKALAATDCGLDGAALGVLARVALDQGEARLAYTASGHGLRSEPSLAARFLLYRAMSLPGYAHTRRGECFDAALFHARRSGDPSMVDEILAGHERSGDRPGWMPWYADRPLQPASPARAHACVARERAANEFPHDPTDDRIECIGTEDCPCRKCNPPDAFPEEIFGGVELIDDDDEADDEVPFPGMPLPPLPPFDAVDDGIGAVVEEMLVERLRTDPDVAGIPTDALRMIVSAMMDDAATGGGDLDPEAVLRSHPELAGALEELGLYRKPSGGRRRGRRKRGRRAR